MIRFILSMLFFSSACLAEPTNKLIILTTFNKSSITPVAQRFQQLYPGASIKLVHRRVESGQRLLEKNNHDIDIVISSSPSLFSSLIEQDKLLPLDQLGQSFVSEQKALEQTMNENVAVFGYSGYGLMWNKKYLAKHLLDIPESWESLVHPQYYRHIIMSSPARSGTTHLMVENILQRYGWEEGWKILLQIGGNLGSLSARSFGISDAVSRGLAGIGPVIDSFARETQKQFPFVGFHYQSDSPRLPSYIAAVKNTNQARHSLTFIEYLLSDQVQQNLSSGSMNKFGLHQLATPHFSVVPLDHDLRQQRELLVKPLFDQIITHQLLLLNQAWQLLHKIDQEKPLTSAQRRLYNLAFKLASTPPVCQLQANSQEYLLGLTRSRSDIETAKRVNQWRQVMRSQLEQSITISEQLLADIKEAN